VNRHRGRPALHWLGLAGVIFVLCAAMIAFGLYLVGVRP